MKKLFWFIALLCCATGYFQIHAQNAQYACWNPTGSGPKCPVSWPADDNEPPCMTFFRDGKQAGTMIVREGCLLNGVTIKKVETIK